jgi:hypothetical protein
MALTASEKQKTYREKKAKELFFGNDFSVTRCLREARITGNTDDLENVFEEIYDRYGPDALQKIAVDLYALFTAVNAVKTAVREVLK